ncbi:MAG: T9SS type A sorting domain-containing protein [Ignavibacteria bacterium]|nr:T9SS type A sorting domain-containing protein [Ignavibacteria bacterium]
MKKISLLFLLTFIITFPIFSQNGWETVFNTYISNDIKFITSNKIIASGDDGKIYRSTDGGLNWNMLSIGTNGQRFYQIFVLDSSNVYICGFNNAVYKSTDYGLSWLNIKPQNFFGHYYTISFVNPLNGVLAGNSKIATTTNGGSTWELKRQIQNTVFTGSFYTGNSDIFLAGDSSVALPNQHFGIIEYSSDNGNSWSRKFSFENIYGGLNGLNFFDADNGIATAKRYVIITSNGGMNWIKQDFQGVNLTNGLILDENILYLTGFNGLIMKSINGGLSWSNQTSGISSTLRNITFINADLGFTSGDTHILKTSNGGVTALISDIENIPSQFSLSQNYPNPFNPVTKIKFDIPASVETTRWVVFLKIHDILGREVAVLVNEQLRPGSYEVDWDASALPTGIYFYTINTSSFDETRKMVLLK